MAEQTLKRFLDIVLSLSALIAFCPALLGLMVLVKLTSRGPVFFRQRRLGLGGNSFWICKFRTMHNNAEDIRNADGSAYSSNHDARVTPLGRWLRRTSLDELPQLWNVLKGEMSLVGPRPDQVDQLRYYSPLDQAKLNVRPGITGLAQIHGRNRIDWEKRRKLDCEYVERWSTGLDISILLKTIPYVLLRCDVNAEDANAGKNSSAAF
jgi:lipopolysaccharide/colanic/teichoic acid biosynthesis glycosyltransferase